jgi:hypothetical protein
MDPYARLIRRHKMRSALYISETPNVIDATPTYIHEHIPRSV